ncbi:MAG: CRISPR-associated helicase Cas3' [Chloroflexi bacterium]|nr:CRISPR-associated helicase Cas3' [Chloroflexota bacterium]
MQIHERVERFVARLFPEGHRPPAVLAVPGYDPDADAADVALAGYDYYSAGHHDDGKPWASEHPKRFLAAQIAVGTVDQALLGALKVKNAHMRTACLSRNLLVVDEVHASDAYMTEILAALLDAHRQAGGYALLMSATLGSVARRRWLDESGESGIADAIDVPYPAVSTRGDTIDAGENDQAKTVAMSSRPVMREPDAVAQFALDAARAGAKVLVVRNTVNYAVNTWQAVAERAGPFDKLGMNAPTRLHHGRYAAGDRRLLDARVEELLGKDSQPMVNGCVVVGTQTLEQSLDIDADLLITDLCPVDVLLQRIGRLHRHTRDNRPAGYDAPACIVLTPPGDDLSPLLDSGQDANGLGPHGYVYRNLHVLEATRRLIEKYDEWRIPEMNRRLVENATHPTALERITDELGDEWKNHGIDVEGSYFADKLTAEGNTIKREKSFYPEEDNEEICKGWDNEVKIRTRLGDDRVDIIFEPAPVSPFDGAAIERIAMTVRWLDGSGSVPESVETTDMDGGFEFGVGSRRFRYDRLGLRRA